MSRTWRLRVWTRFLCEPATVWAHKTDPEMLAREFRPYVFMTMSGADQEVVRRTLSTGAEHTEVLARLSPPGLDWPMAITVVEPGRHYRDVSRNALFKHWAHDHQILSASDGCLYIDDLVFVSALPFCKATALTMERLMKHRHSVAARHLPAEPGAVGVSVLRLDCPSGAG